MSKLKRKPAPRQGDAPARARKGYADRESADRKETPATTTKSDGKRTRPDSPPLIVTNELIAETREESRSTDNHPTKSSHHLSFTPSAIEKALVTLTPDDDIEAVLREHEEYADEVVDFLEHAHKYFRARPDIAKKHEDSVRANWSKAKGRRLAFLDALHDERVVLVAKVLAPVRRDLTDKAVKTHLGELSRYLASGPRGGQASG